MLDSNKVKEEIISFVLESPEEVNCIVDAFISSLKDQKDIANCRYNSDIYSFIASTYNLKKSIISP